MTQNVAAAMPLPVLEAQAASARSRVDRIEARLRDPNLGAGSPIAVELREALGRARQELADARRTLAVRQAQR